MHSLNMKKYLTQIFFYFIIPIALIAIVWEYSIRSIPNDYAYKSDWLSKNGKDIEVMYLGPSTIMYDINPSLSKMKGFNAAHVSQSIRYDNFIFNKYIDQMQSLKHIVLGVDYWSPFGHMEQSTEWWRVKYYTIHYGSPYHENKGKYKYEIYFHNPRTLKIANQGLARLLGVGNVSHITINELGYGTNYTTNNKSVDWDNGATEAERHNALISGSKDDMEAYRVNTEHISDICRKSEERGIKVTLLAPPIYKSYTSVLDKEHIASRNEFCQSIADMFDNTVFLDLSDSNLFSAEDFYDANHLNEIGAEKLTKMIDNNLN